VPKPAATYWLTRAAIVRGLGFIYFIAFLSWFNQLVPLMGANGLDPVPDYLDWIRQRVGDTAWDGFLYMPSIFWLNASDAFMCVIACVGMGLALAVLAGATNAVLMGVLWFLYMSVVHVGQRWYSYGWEMMTLEAGFLAIFLCPLRGFRNLDGDSPPSRVVIFFFKWMVFRVMFGAGLIKLRGDACWTDLTCLAYHYETQPIPNPLSWYLHHMPLWFHGFSVLWNANSHTKCNKATN
jgi:hypothetical protein